MSYIAGIDLGATNVRMGLFKARGEQLEPISFLKERIPDRSPESVARLIFSRISEQHMPEAIAIGVPGMVSRDGIIRRAPNLDWTDVDFASLLSSISGARVRLMNDLNAITWGEYMLGDRCPNMVCIFMGTGIGAGLIIDGHLVEGSHGMAGEVGHMKVSLGAEPRLCGCGNQGCIEAYLGGGNFASWIREELDRWEGSIPELPEDLHPGSFDSLAAQGHPFAVKIWDEASRALASVLSSIQVLLDPEKIVMGGTVWKGASRLRALTGDKVRELLPSAYTMKLVTSTLGDEAGIWGAAYTALSSLKGDYSDAS